VLVVVQRPVGNSNNRSWNHGAEGPTDDPAIKGLRKRQMKNMLATLLLSQGTPMMPRGATSSRTRTRQQQRYCQDNEISWIDWNVDEPAERLIRFGRSSPHFAQVSDPGPEALSFRPVQRGARVKDVPGISTSGNRR